MLILLSPLLLLLFFCWLLTRGGQRRRLIQLQARTTVATERLAGIEPPPAMPWWRWVMVGMIVIASVIGVIVVHHGEDTTAPAQADAALPAPAPPPSEAIGTDTDKFEGRCGPKCQRLSGVTPAPPPSLAQHATAQRKTIDTPSGRAIGPSFDCNTEQTPEAQFICASPDLSRADLEFGQAYYALRQQVGPAGWQALKRENLDSQHRTDVRCGITPGGTLPPDTVAFAACLRLGYTAQRSIWLSRLSGAALEEASRPAEQHVALQRDLQVLGFLPPTATIDGVYGAATRTAISAWQRANNQPDTGFISNTDAGLLTNTGRSTKAVAAPIPSATQPSAAYRLGQADRQAWESWFAGTSGDYHRGAFYWSAQRSLRNPGSCNVAPPSTGADWTAGCYAAQQKLAATDVRRKTEPGYRLGWNSVPAVAPSSAPTGEASSSRTNTGASGATAALQGTPNTSPLADTEGEGAYDAAQAVFLGCVQSQRSPAWSEFAQPPSGEPAYTAWSNRFLSASLQASERCQRQEASAASAICKVMQEQPPLCKTWLNVLVGNVMSGRTICDATHCVTAIQYRAVSVPPTRTDNPATNSAGPTTPAQTTVPAESGVGTAAPAVNRAGSENFMQCLLPKAQYGQYSSYDGGRSAEALLMACKSEWLVWEKSCEKTGGTKDDCVLNGVITAQIAIKTFNK